MNVNQPTNQELEKDADLMVFSTLLRDFESSIGQTWPRRQLIVDAMTKFGANVLLSSMSKQETIVTSRDEAAYAGKLANRYKELMTFVNDEDEYIDIVFRKIATKHNLTFVEEMLAYMESRLETL